MVHRSSNSRCQLFPYYVNILNVSYFQKTSGHLFSSQRINIVLPVYISTKTTLFSGEVTIKTKTCTYFQCLTDPCSLLLAKWDHCNHVNGSICFAECETPYLIHGTLVWVEWGGGDVHGCVTWISNEGRRGMIWSRIDSWAHNARLPAAAWRIQREGNSYTQWLLQTPSTLLIITNWASGSN